MRHHRAERQVEEPVAGGRGARGLREAAGLAERLEQRRDEPDAPGQGEGGRVQGGLRPGREPRRRHAETERRGPRGEDGRIRAKDEPDRRRRRAGTEEGPARREDGQQHGPDGIAEVRRRADHMLAEVAEEGGEILDPGQQRTQDPAEEIGDRCELLEQAADEVRQGLDAMAEGLGPGADDLADEIVGDVARRLGGPEQQDDRIVRHIEIIAIGGVEQVVQCVEPLGQAVLHLVDHVLEQRVQRAQAERIPDVSRHDVPRIPAAASRRIDDPTWDPPPGQIRGLPGRRGGREARLRCASFRRRARNEI